MLTRLVFMKGSRPPMTSSYYRYAISVAGARFLSSQADAVVIKDIPRKTPSKLKIYSDLAKFRLSSLVVVTTGAGFLCAGAPIDLSTMAAACMGTALCAASAGTFNQVIEKERDASMKRTRNRPLPSGAVSPAEASAFGLLTGAAGTTLLYSMTNPVVAALGAVNIALYAGPYTVSKQHSELNTWIGSIVGAIPPVMGWAAATGGSIFAPEPLALASLLFLWQFPHFFALSWMYRDDYARGGYQMVAVNDPTGARTANLINEYSLYLSALPIITSATGMTSWMFAVEGTVANLYLLYLARKFREEHSNANARKVFLCSLWYLPVLLGGMVFHSVNWSDSKVGVKEGEEEEERVHQQFSVLVHRAKTYLRSVCMHEVIATHTHQHQQSNNSNSSSSTDDDVDNSSSDNDNSLIGAKLCMKKGVHKVVDAAVHIPEAAVQAAATAAATTVTTSDEAPASAAGAAAATDK